MNPEEEFLPEWLVVGGPTITTIAAAAADDDDDDDIGDGRPNKGHLMDEMRRNRGWREIFRYEKSVLRGLSRATAEL